MEYVATTTQTPRYTTTDYEFSDGSRYTTTITKDGKETVRYAADSESATTDSTRTSLDAALATATQIDF